MHFQRHYKMESLILYTGFNIVLSREFEDENKPKGEPMLSGIPIYAIGGMLYESYFKNKDIIGRPEIQELIFRLLFQTTCNALIYKHNTPLLIDALLVTMTAATNAVLP